MAECWAEPRAVQRAVSSAGRLVAWRAGMMAGKTAELRAELTAGAWAVLTVGPRVVRSAECWAADWAAGWAAGLGVVGRLAGLGWAAELGWPAG